MSEQNDKKKISNEFVQNVKKWLEIDDTIKEIRVKTKQLTSEKKEREQVEAEGLKLKAEAEANASAKAAILAKLGITAEEAALLLS